MLAKATVNLIYLINILVRVLIPVMEHPDQSQMKGKEFIWLVHHQRKSRQDLKTGQELEGWS